MKYQSSSTHCSKVISKVKVFLKMGQTPSSRSQGKKQLYPRKGLITGKIHVKYQIYLALTVQKLLARLKFQRGGQNDRQDKNNMPPDHFFGQ